MTERLMDGAFSDCAIDLRIDDVIVGDRVRKGVGDIVALQVSMTRLGQLQPIGVTAGNVLVFGWRRLEAARAMAWETIRAVRLDSLTDAGKLALAEQDENTCREGFTPLEQLEMAKRIELLIPKKKPGPKSDLSPENNSGGTSPVIPEEDDTRRQDKIAKAVGTSPKRLRKIAKVANAAKSDPETFGPIADEMNATGDVESAFRAVQQTLVPPAPVDGETIRNRALASLLDVERALGDLCETEAGGNVNRDKALAALFRLRSLIVGGARKVVRRGPFNPAEIDLPVELDTEAFRAKWREWCEYRADKRKPVSAVAAARSLEKCRAAGAEAACRAIDDAIAADWQGLFPKANGAAAGNDKLAGVREILSGPSRPRRGQTVAPGVELLEGGGDGLPW